LEESTALFISQYLLGSLRSSAPTSDARYLAVERELSTAVEALELEVGETRRRREVEGELELLRGMEGREDLLATFGKAAEGIEESSLLLNAVEERSLGGREGIEQICEYRDGLTVLPLMSLQISRSSSSRDAWNTLRGWYCQIFHPYVPPSFLSQDP
jgi:hypothetical protein